MADLHQGITIGRARVTVLGGLREIGGNCVVVSSDSGAYIFDQGLRFSAFSRYFGGYLRPRSVSELRELGVLPDITSYGDASVFITHFHLDHVGLLGNLVPGMRLYVPETYGVFIDWYRNRPDWLSYMEPRVGVTVDPMRPMSNIGPVKVFMVMHSAYPSYAYLYDDGDARILYTGDLRLDSPLWHVDRKAYSKIYGDSLLTDLEDLEADLLIIEGTNYSGRADLVTAKHVAASLSEILADPRRHLVILSIDHMDLDLFLAASSLSISNNRSIIILSKRLTDMARHWAEQGLITEEVARNTYYAEDELSQQTLTEQAVKKPEEFAIFASIEDTIDIIRSLPGDSQKPKILISMEAEGPESGGPPEPITEWLSLGHVITYRLRLSGHYYPYQLGKILKAVKPGAVLPIHTEEPETVCLHARSINNHVECLLPGSDIA